MLMKTKMFNGISLALFSVPGQSLFPVCLFPIQYPFVFSDQVEPPELNQTPPSSPPTPVPSSTSSLTTLISFPLPLASLAATTSTLELSSSLLLFVFEPEDDSVLIDISPCSHLAM